MLRSTGQRTTRVKIHTLSARGGLQAPAAAAIIEQRTYVSPASTENSVFLRSLLREPVPYTPVWLMRQAGRYLPEYNATRARAGSFLGLAKNPDYACEVTLQPLDRFALDAAILFSDILTVPDAMGLGLSFEQGEGPRFAHPIRTEQDVARLAVPDMESLRYVFDAVDRFRRESVHSLLLYGRGQGERRLPSDQNHDVLPPGSLAPDT